jgi:hypothetical protein
MNLNRVGVDKNLKKPRGNHLYSGRRRFTAPPNMWVPVGEIPMAAEQMLEGGGRPSDSVHPVRGPLVLCGGQKSVLRRLQIKVYNGDGPPK